MAQAIIVIQTEVKLFAAGTTDGGVKVSIVDANGVEQHQVLTAAPYEATFTGLVPGAFTGTVEAVDATGAGLGNPVAFNFEALPDVSIVVPVSVAVTVS